MSNLYLNSPRPNSLKPGAAIGLLLALGLLAGCQSNPSAPPPATKPVDTANLSAVDTGTVDQNPQQALRDRLTQVGDRVLFETDHYDINATAEGTLRMQAALLQTYPSVTITIEGHADERGTREYNLALADRRADAVRNYLTALGVSPERIETVSYGKERPDCADVSDSCWARNRRGVTVVNQ